VDPSTEAQAGVVLERCRRKAGAVQAAAARVSRKRSIQVPTPSGGCLIDATVGESIAAETEEDPDVWICGHCTMQNKTNATGVCNLCGTRRHAFPEVTIVAGKDVDIDEMSSQVVINYELPTATEYVRRLSALVPAKQRPPMPLRVAYTLVDEKDMKGRRAKDMCQLLRAAQQGVDRAKATEFDSVLDFFENMDYEEEEEDEEEEDEDEDDDCDCTYCRGGMLGCTSFHTMPNVNPRRGVLGKTSGVEVVRVPLRALEDMDKAVPFIAPRVVEHQCTLICLHCLFAHTPWDGWEQFFAPPELNGTIRVVMVLAEDTSWHEYHDHGLLCAGGAPWMDILNMDSMNRTDALLEELINHEAALLNGHSERIVLMGMSQGGGQSMLRFLRSPIRLGGWIGSVCHVPTVPHTPRQHDPLLGGPAVNRDRPVRLLAGELDKVFPPGIILRDAARLRNVGGFTDVQVEVRSEMEHEGLTSEAKLESDSPVMSPTGSKKARTSEAIKLAAKMRRAERDAPDLFFVQKHLPQMVKLAAAD